MRCIDPTLFVIGEDLELNGEVDLADADAVRNVDDRRSEVQDAGHASSNERIGGILGRRAGGGDHADRDVAGLDDLLDLIEVPDSHAAAELDLIQIRALVEDLIATHADWLPRWITEEKAD